LSTSRLDEAIYVNKLLSIVCKVICNQNFKQKNKLMCFVFSYWMFREMEWLFNMFDN